MLRMTAELSIFSNMDTCHNVFVNHKRIGGVYVYQKRYGEVCIVACHKDTLQTKLVRTLTDGVKWLVVKEAMRNV